MIRVILWVLITVNCFAQAEDVDVLEYKLKYEDVVKKQIYELLRKLLKEYQFVATVTADITPETEIKTRRITTIPPPDNVDITVWSIYEDNKKQVEERITESKHRIDKVSATILLDKKLSSEIEEEVKDIVLKSLKDIKSENLMVKRINLVSPVHWTTFFEQYKNYIILLVIAIAIVLFLFGPLRRFMKDIVGFNLGKEGKNIKIQVNEESSRGQVIGESIKQEVRTMEERTETKAAEKGPFSFIKKENLKNLAYILQDESVDMISLIMTYLNEEESAEVMALFPEELQMKIAIEMAKVKQTSEESVLEAEKRIKDKINFLIGGIDRFAGLLENLDEQTREGILSSLDKESPDLAVKIRKEIFVFENITDLDDTALQLVLRDIKTNLLAKALTNAPAEVVNKIKRNISGGALTLLQEEMNLVGILTPIQIEKERKGIVSKIKSMEKQGKIALRRERRKIGKISKPYLKEKGVRLEDYEGKDTRNVLSLRRILKGEDKKDKEESLFVSKKVTNKEDKT